MPEDKNQKSAEPFAGFIAVTAPDVNQFLGNVVEAKNPAMVFSATPPSPTPNKQLKDKAITDDESIQSEAVLSKLGVIQKKDNDDNSKNISYEPVDDKKYRLVLYKQAGRIVVFKGELVNVEKDPDEKNPDDGKKKIVLKEAAQIDDETFSNIIRREESLAAFITSDKFTFNPVENFSIPVLSKQKYYYSKTPATQDVLFTVSDIAEEEAKMIDLVVKAKVPFPAEENDNLNKAIPNLRKPSGISMP